LGYWASIFISSIELIHQENLMNQGIILFSILSQPLTRQLPEHPLVPHQKKAL